MISVVLCTYNGERYIREELDSIISQTLSVDEIIIRDDCSEDSTCVILDEYASRYPIIDFKRNSSNLGFVKNFENSLNECQGDFIFFADQDDIWDVDKVKTCVKYLEKSGMYGVYTDGKLIDEYGKPLGETIFSRIKLNPYIENHILPNYEFEITCLNGNHVTGATLAIIKTAKNLLIPFRTTKYLLHDMWIASKLSSINKLGRIDMPLISYRLHTGQGCGLNMDNNNDILIGCFQKKGTYENLLKLRYRTIAPIYYFKLGRKERRRIYCLYKSLFMDCLKGGVDLMVMWRFCIMELILFIKTRTGFRID